MPKSTIFFACLAIVFAITTAFVTWRLLTDHDESLPQVASIALGLPREGGGEDQALFRAASVLVWNSETQSIQFEQNGFERRPIASITKLMTAMVALDHGIPWEEPMAIELEEYVQGGRLLLQPGETATARDLFRTSLMSSANNATLAYVRAVGIPPEEFVREMNRKAVSLGLEQTEFTDVTGLDVGNVSTAYEVARMASVAFAYPEIAEATSLKEYAFTLGGSGREHLIRNSNKLMTEWGEEVSGSKTGYLYEARYCLVVRGAGESASRLAVVLGSPSEIESLAEMKKLLHAGRL